VIACRAAQGWCGLATTIFRNPGPGPSIPFRADARTVMTLAGSGLLSWRMISIARKGSSRPANTGLAR